MSINVKTISVGILDANCYIVEKDDVCLIIDPGDELEKIVREIVLKPIGILVTHSHFDHVGALDQLKKIYKIPVYKFENLEEGTINIGNFKIDIIYTPGHADDCITYYFKDDEIMFTGDFLFKNSIGRTDLMTGSDTKMKKSISKILEYNDIIRVYPGHGPSTTLGLEKENNYYLK